MIHYHGTPITPNDVAHAVLAGRHAMVSFEHPRDLPLVAEVCQSFALDNGAFSAWVAGRAVTDWQPFYDWAAAWRTHPGCDWILMPDVIDGSEADNDALVEAWPLPTTQGVPVWHLHESLGRLATLVADWPRVALGSSGVWRQPGTRAWWERMNEAMTVACDEAGRPRCKLHGLRMLAPDIAARLPLSSADSCNVALNIGLDRKWAGPYEPPNQRVRALVLAARIEAAPAAPNWDAPPRQYELEGLV